MYLGIEIGGTKLQLGIGAGDGSPLVRLERFDVDPAQGAEGILRRIERAALDLLDRHAIRAVGCGFGGPVDAAGGRVVKSHHVAGWDRFELAGWLGRVFAAPAVIANDADTAGLAEAQFGAGRGASPVLYVTVGTGIGAGLILDGRIYTGNGAGAAELGHLRPGLHADRPEENLESLAAGWGIAATAQARLSGGAVSHRFSSLSPGLDPHEPDAVRQRLIETEEADEEHAADLLSRCDGNVERLTTRQVAQAAEEGNGIAQEILSHATQALGWGLAQAITLLSPAVVVIGGGVSLIGEQWFFTPLRREVQRYVFPPYIDTYRIVPAQLGEEVVVHGALALARQAGGDSQIKN